MQPMFILRTHSFVVEFDCCGAVVTCYLCLIGVLISLSLQAASLAGGNGPAPCPFVFSGDVIFWHELKRKCGILIIGCEVCLAAFASGFNWIEFFMTWALAAVLRLSLK